ncbi:helix-turn-helix domain-containing protein [Streptomyces sp. NE06-03C]|uniref:MarR family winged helix-turn-helix transcriptional regulator n=1 Tax=Streptomyces sp. NE06-03C TaxID=3028694 RepID=UPI0029A38F83|nr:helix-turn-helix domain-containing protein [Streptomyces sp. NE06-03C]MDX2916932.1 helix-turn-helix domain-containing protein [Streptomyces sp. NE06-03C]
MRHADDRPNRSGASDSEAPLADLQAFAVELRRMNGEINRMTHGFAVNQRLHPTDVSALGAILDAPSPLTPGALREHLGLTSGAVTACLDRLERAGHIRRARESADRRVVHVYYEPSARTVARDYFMPLAEATARARARFSEGELTTVLRFLAAMNEEMAEAFLYTLPRPTEPSLDPLALFRFKKKKKTAP